MWRLSKKTGTIINKTKVKVDQSNELKTVSETVQADLNAISVSQNCLETKVIAIESKLNSVQVVQDLITNNINLTNKLRDYNPIVVENKQESITPPTVRSEVITSRDQSQESVIQDSNQRE